MFTRLPSGAKDWASELAQIAKAAFDAESQHHEGSL